MPVVTEWQGHDVDVAVIGAGAAGIGAARRLQALRPDLSLLVLEAGGRLGGRAHTMNLAAGIACDLGCGWLHGARTNEWTRIAREFGLALDLTPAPWDVEQGKDPLGLSAQDIAEWNAARSAYFARVEARGEDGADASLAEALEPDNPWNGRLDAVATYINGVEMAGASIADYNRYDPGPGPDWRVRAGYGHLVSTYGAPLPVMLGAAVEQVDHRAGDRIELVTSRGNLRARAVVVAVSTTVLAHERIRFVPALPAKLAAAASLPLGLDNKLFLKLVHPEDLPIDARLMGKRSATRSGSYQIRPMGNPVIEAYFGGDLAWDLERAGEDAAAAFAIEELAAHFGNDFKRGLSLAAASAWGSNRYIGGGYSYAKPGHADARGRLAAPVDNRLFFAGEATALKRFSTAHGAFETGVAAAETISVALPHR
ncbi:MAG TPA: FAD-dependent oxidoreductase [Stellaceae bacterium]|nr:FAD-dependent oxidoreductase [Stellaceae bacterium]